MSQMQAELHKSQSSQYDLNRHPTSEGSIDLAYSIDMQGPKLGPTNHFTLYTEIIVSLS